jgi:hypothetical protein
MSKMFSWSHVSGRCYVCITPRHPFPVLLSMFGKDERVEEEKQDEIYLALINISF